MKGVGAGEGKNSLKSDEKLAAGGRPKTPTGKNTGNQIHAEKTIKENRPILGSKKTTEENQGRARKNHERREKNNMVPDNKKTTNRPGSITRGLWPRRFFSV